MLANTCRHDSLTSFSSSGRHHIVPHILRVKQLKPRDVRPLPNWPVKCGVVIQTQSHMVPNSKLLNFLYPSLRCRREKGKMEELVSPFLELGMNRRTGRRFFVCFEKFKTGDFWRSEDGRTRGLLTLCILSWEKFFRF